MGMPEVIIIKNNSDKDVKVLWNEIEYVCRAHAQAEIPGSILWKFLEFAGIEKLKQKQVENIEEIAPQKAPPFIPVHGVYNTNIDCEGAIAYPPSESFKSPVLNSIPEEKAREMARSDAASIRHHH
jgi:hypothetical protein